MALKNDNNVSSHDQSYYDFMSRAGDVMQSHLTCIGVIHSPHGDMPSLFKLLTFSTGSVKFLFAFSVRSGV